MVRKRRNKSEAENTYLQKSSKKESTIGDKAEEIPRENQAGSREQGRRGTS